MAEENKAEENKFYIHPNARAASPPSANPDRYKKPPMGNAENIFSKLKPKAETAKEKEEAAEKYAAELVSKLYGK